MAHYECTLETHLLLQVIPIYISQGRLYIIIVSGFSVFLFAMSGLRTYTVRPFSKPQRSDLKDAFRAFLSPGTLLLNKLRSGDTCYLETETVSAPIQAWTAHEKIQDNIVQTSKLLQELHGLRLGDKVSIRRDEAPLTEIQTVSLSEIPSELEKKTISIGHQGHWEWFLEYPLQRAELICVGMVFDSIEAKGQKRSFKVEQINSSRLPDRLYQFVSHSMVQLNMTRGSLDESRSSLEITRDGIGGLTHQIEVLNQWLAEYDDMDDWLEPVSYERFCRGGILLHGPYGTGKTLILRKIAQAQWRKTFHVDLDVLAEYGGKPATALSKIFGDALQHQPSVIIMDNFEFLVGGQDLPGSPLSNSIALSLCKDLDRIDGSRVLLVAAINKLNDVNERLRQYFINNIEIALPDSKARGEILKILCDLPRDTVEEKLDTIADRTPGYSGRDLFLLVQRAIKKAKIRIRASQFEDDKGPHGSTNSNSGSSKISGRSLKMGCKIEMIDYDNARAEVRPTTMQAITLEMPKVRWNDIGGQNKTKELLMQAVEWPLTVRSFLQTFPITSANCRFYRGHQNYRRLVSIRRSHSSFTVLLDAPKLLWPERLLLSIL